MDWNRIKPHLQHFAISVGIGAFAWTWTHPPFAQEWLTGIVVGLGLFTVTAFCQFVARGISASRPP